jgi:hypothetical protein
MSVGGIGGRAEEVLARLEATTGSGPSLFSAFDAVDNVRDAIGALAGRSVIGADDIERVVREAKDYGSINAAEQGALRALLVSRAGAFEPAARVALARFLGVPDPLPPPAAAPDRAPVGSTGRVDVLRDLSRLHDPSVRAAFRDDPALQRVLLGQATLAAGARGGAVVEVQAALLDAGFDLGAAGADGDFGGGTRTAVAALQRREGLAATGVIDAATLAALGRLAGPDHRRDLASPLIEGGIGPGQPNAPGDVAAVQERLRALGFYQGPVNGRPAAELYRAVRVFDSVVANAEHLPIAGPERREAEALTPGEATELWARAANAPRWTRLAASGPGWVNGDRDRHGHATDWLADALVRAGARYEQARAAHPGWTAIHTNDASMRHAGDTPDHDSHEVGLDLDVKLGAGRLTHRHRSYDREETWAKVQAFLDDPAVERILFNDPELIRRADGDPAYRGRLARSDGHDDHLHIDFRVPQREPR